MRPAGDLMAGGHEGARRGPRSSTTTATDIVPTILECCGLELPGLVQGYEQTPLPGVSMRYSFDDADAPTAQEESSTTRCSARAGIWKRGLEGRDRARADERQRRLREDRWQLFHTDEDRAEAHDLADPAPREGASNWSPCGSSEAGNTTYCRSTTYTIEERSSRVLEPEFADPARRASLHLLPGHARGARVRRRQHARRLLQDPRGGRAPPGAQGVIFAAGRPLRRAHAVHQGRQALLRVQLPRDPARAAAHPPHRARPGTICSASSSSRSGWASTTRRYGTAKLYVDDQVVAEERAADA